jgi:hypothetical protein
VLIDLASDRDGFAALAALVGRGGTALTTRYTADTDALAAAGVTGINFALRMTAELLARLADGVVSGRYAAPPITTVRLCSRRCHDAAFHVPVETSDPARDRGPVRFQGRGDVGLSGAWCPVPDVSLVPAQGARTRGCPVAAGAWPAGTPRGTRHFAASESRRGYPAGFRRRVGWSALGASRRWPCSVAGAPVKVTTRSAARARIEIPSSRAETSAHVRSRSACSNRHAARETRVRTRRSRRPASIRSLIVTRPSCQPRSGNWTPWRC